MTQKKNINATLKMTISMIIFGSVGFFSTQTNLPSMELVFVRCIFATLFLGSCWLITGQYKKDKWEKKEFLQVLICGFFLVFNWVFLFKAFENMSITISISIYHLAPVIVLILGSIIFKEKLTIFSIISIILCFLGALLIAGIDGDFSLNSLMQSGMIWGLLAALFYAFTTLFGKGIKTMNAYAITFLQTGLGTIILFPFINFSAFMGLTIENWIYIIATGLIHTGIVYYLFFDSIRNLSTKIISILVFLDPAVAILLDMVLTGFKPTLLQIGGIAFIFIGMTFTLKTEERKNKVVDQNALT